MTHIVIENCINCKYTDCVEVCPVDCFYENKNFLVINPDECIDCSICLPECPIESIIKYDKFEYNLIYKINFEFSKIWKNLKKKKNPFLNYEKWNLIKNKLHLLKI